MNKNSESTENYLSVFILYLYLSREEKDKLV